ncbi:MAG: hypothetical protein R6U32_07100 [Candidatus Woesearchaeota archaeon]
MSSQTNGLLKNRKSQGMTIKVIIITILALAVGFVVIYMNIGKTAKAAQFSCSIPLSSKEGYCVEDKDDCDGTIHPLAEGCPEEKPSCCLGSKKDREEIEEKTGGEDAEEKDKVASVQFWIKASASNEDIAFEPSDEFARYGRAYGRTYKGTTLEMQARGIDIVDYCRISMSDKSKSGKCSETKGPVISHTFDNPGSYKIRVSGYEKEGGEEMAMTQFTMKVMEEEK